MDNIENADIIELEDDKTANIIDSLIVIYDDSADTYYIGLDCGSDDDNDGFIHLRMPFIYHYEKGATKPSFLSMVYIDDDDGVFLINQKVCKFIFKPNETVTQLYFEHLSRKLQQDTNQQEINQQYVDIASTFDGHSDYLVMTITRQ